MKPLMLNYNLKQYYLQYSYSDTTMELQTTEQKILKYSHQIQNDPLNTSFIYERSLQYSLNGMVDEAIADLSKIIYLEPSRRTYVCRSQLYHSKKMYASAIEDIEQAKQYSANETADHEIDFFLQKSLAVQHLPQIKEIISKLEEKKELTKKQIELKHTVQDLLKMKNLEITVRQKEHEKRIADLENHYKQQFKIQQYLLAQVKELKEKVQKTKSITDLNFQRVFLNWLDQESVSQSNKQKLTIYFHFLASEMEKYYIAAKNLHTFDDKTIKFEDLESMVNKKKSPDYLKKLYKIFDREGDKIQKLQELIQNIPYIGSAFKIVKGIMKLKGWIEQVNLDAQCTNIQQVAYNITAFNQFASNLAFYLTRYYKLAIIEPHKPYKSAWEQLTNIIAKTKQQKFGDKSYKVKRSDEEEKVKDYAIVHASIIMVAYACNKNSFGPNHLIHANDFYQKKDEKSVQAILRSICQLIDEAELSLKVTIQYISEVEIQKRQRNCQIY